MLDPAYTLHCPELALAGTIDETDKLVVEKQLIYEGSFRHPKDGYSFSVDEKLIDHWVNTHGRLTSNGVDVPLPVEHTQDPEKRRGTVVGLSKKSDPKGRMSLYGKIKFRDEKARDAFKDSDVSLYSPPQWEDGSKNVYYRPIRHVALTDYPVINDLDGFKTIRASHVGEEKPMPLKALAKSLGIEVKDESSDDDLSKAISAKFTSLNTTISELKKAKKPDEPAKKAEAKKEDDKPQAIAASIVSMVGKARKSEISNLVRDGKITPAVAKDLEDQFACDDAVSLSLSMDEGSSDGFDSMMEALKKNESVLRTEEQTKGQGLKLSAEDNPLIADAERRAKAAT